MEFNYQNIIKNKNQKIKHILEICDRKDKEIERLNNIINELEKWLEEDNNKAMITFETGRCFNYHDIINKIEILKGEYDEKDRNSNTILQ